MGDSKRRIIGSLICLVLTFSNYLNAAVKDDFTQGVNFFTLGEYKNAAIKFEEARTNGLKSVALYYNLGSSYFKLKNYGYAQRYFQELLNVPKMKSLAQYNLGLIAVRQHKSQLANQHFKAVVKQNVDKKLVFLSRQQLNPPRKKIKTKSWSIYSSANLGYDDNINVKPVGTTLNESDSFYDILFLPEFKISGNRKNGWFVNALFSRTDYSTSQRYDFNSYGAGIKKTLNIANWSSYFKLNLSKYTYGGKDYQSVARLEARTKRKLSINQRLYLSYRYENISSDRPIYTYLDGWRQKVKAELRKYNKNYVFQVYYELELNNRQDYNSAQDSLSYSPTRHTLRSKYTRILSKTWRLGGDLYYRKSDYPVTLTQDRNDSRWKAAIYTDYRINKNMRMRGKFEFTRNDSTDPLYIYDRNIFSIGLSKNF